MPEGDLRQRIAERFLKLTPAEANVNRMEIKIIDVSRFWQNERGGAALLVNDAGEMLFANSSVSLDEHIAAWVVGRRTDPSLFQE